MRGIAIIVAGADPARFRAALTLAAAHAALGGRTRLLLDGEAAALAAGPCEELLESCFDLGATVILCQSGLAMSGVAAAELDARFDYGGMTGFLADIGGDRLVMV